MKYKQYGDAAEYILDVFLFTERNNPFIRFISLCKLFIFI